MNSKQTMLDYTVLIEVTEENIELLSELVSEEIYLGQYLRESAAEGVLEVLERDLVNDLYLPIVLDEGSINMIREFIRLDDRPSDESLEIIAIHYLAYPEDVREALVGLGWVDNSLFEDYIEGMQLFVSIDSIRSAHMEGLKATIN